MATGRRRGRAIILIAFIVILLIAMYLVLTQGNLLNRGGQQAEKPPASVPTATLSPEENVVVVAQKVTRGQEIKPEHLAVGKISRESYNPTLYYKEVRDLTGTKAKFDLEAGTLLTKSMVVRPGDSGVLPAFEIPQGKVAISIPISKLSSLGYGLQKGDHVNVIVSLLLVDLDTGFQTKLPDRTGIVIAPGPISENQTYITAQMSGPVDYLGRIEIDPTMNNPVYLLPAEEQRPRMVSQTLLQDVVVLQMGSFQGGDATQPQPVATSAPAEQPENQPTPTRTPRSQQQQQATEEAKFIPPDLVTLIVSPQDAVTLNYLMLAGANLNLVLRSAGDSEIRDTEAVTLQFVLDQYRVPNPAKLPYGLQPRVDQFPTRIEAFPQPGPVPTPSE